jgi:clan AA aspartic protease
MQIDGYFNKSDEPVIRLDVGSLSIEILVDTGFNGSLVIPGHVASELNLRFEGLEEFYSVTGEMFFASAYSVEIDWLGKTIRVPVATSPELNEALLGSYMLKECRLTIDYGHRTVTIIES